MSMLTAAELVVDDSLLESLSTELSKAALMRNYTSTEESARGVAAM